MKSKKNMIIPILCFLLISVTMLSGCTGQKRIATADAYMRNVIICVPGYLYSKDTLIWETYIAWGEESHDDYKDYERFEESDWVLDYSGYGKIFGIDIGFYDYTQIQPDEEYHFRAVGHNKLTGEWIYGEDKSFVPFDLVPPSEDFEEDNQDYHALVIINQHFQKYPILEKIFRTEQNLLNIIKK